MRNKLKTLTQLSTSLIFLCLAGCATIEGAGEDIESAGEVIQESAENNN
jgi:predicted small secreted protein